MTNKFSLILFTHNSQDKLDLSSDFLQIFDERIAIDDMSSDKTIPILKRLGFDVKSTPFDGDFGERHNKAMKKTKHDWVFFLDDDEKPDSRLVQSLKQLKEQELSRVGGFLIKRIDKIFGEYVSYGEHGRTQLVRFVNKKNGKWVRKVHEFFETRNEVRRLEGLLLHDQVFGIEKFLDKANYYSPIDAKELTREGKVFGSIQLLRPIAKFIKDYFYLFGFLDGYRGLMLAYLMSVQSLMIRVYQWEQSK